MERFRTTALEKLLLAAGTVTVLMLMSVLAGLFLTRAGQIEAAERASASLALVAEKHFETVFTAVDAAVQTAIHEIGEAERHNEAMSEVINGILARSMEQHRHFFNAILTDSAGAVVADPRYQVPPAVNLADRDFFIAHRAHPDLGLVVGSPVVSRITGDHVIPMTRRIDRPDGSFGGVMSAVVLVRELQDFMRSLRPGPASSVGILWADGRMLTRDPPQPIGFSLADTPAYTAMTSGPPTGTIHIRSAVDGSDCILTWRRLPDRPFIVYTAVAVDEALAGWYRNASLTGSVTLICVVAIGALTGCLVRERIAHDRAEQRRRDWEARRAQARHMESIGRLTAGVAHHFNNIVAGILGFANLLLEDLPAGSPQHRFAERIVGSSKRARDIVRQMLAFSAQERDESMPTDVAAVVGKILPLIRTVLSASARLEVVEYPRPLIAEVSEADIVQIVSNLCLNAKDALSGQPGKIVLEVALAGDDDRTLGKCIKPRAVIGVLRKNRDYVRLTVRDSGMGIEPKELEQIFEPFYTTKDVGHGIGLGLAVVHGTVLGCGGACLVTSTKGEGTAFSVFLPIAAAPAARASLARVV